MVKEEALRQAVMLLVQLQGRALLQWRPQRAEDSRKTVTSELPRTRMPMDLTKHTAGHCLCNCLHRGLGQKLSSQHQ